MALVEAVVEAGLEISIKINKLRISQKIQDVAVEEETREQGGVQGEEVASSNKDRITNMMHVGFVADMVTSQMIVTRDLTKGDLVEEINREIMHQHQIRSMMSIYLLCSI